MMRAAALLALLVAALALAGCGGDDGGGGGEAGGDPAGTSLSGQEVFADAGCGGCHALEEAGATGATGPALDAANLSVDEVAEQVREGGGGMPAFADQLSDAEIQAVSEFVAEASQG